MTLSGLIAGGVCWWASARHAADVIWTVVTAIALVPAVWAVVQGLMRRSVGSDVIAVLAPAGTLATGEFLAGAVIAVMLTGGQAPHRHHRPQTTGTLGPVTARASATGLDATLQALPITVPVTARAVAPGWCGVLLGRVRGGHRRPSREWGSGWGGTRPGWAGGTLQWGDGGLVFGWSEERGWFYGEVKDDGGELAYVSYFGGGVLPAPESVAALIALLVTGDEGLPNEAPTTGRWQYRSFDDSGDGFEADLAAFRSRGGLAKTSTTVDLGDLR